MRKPFVLGKLTLTSAQILVLDSPRPAGPTLLETMLKSGIVPARHIEQAELTTVH